MDFFSEIINDIKTEYAKTSNKLGWRFLTTSKKTLIKNNGIYLITLNPGGDKEERAHSTASCENGCAYLIEKWKNCKGTDSPLQNQFKLLFQEIASKLNKKSYVKLMESSVCGYFIPFRSPNYKELKNKKEAINFSKKLWKKILSKRKFKTILCIDRLTYKTIKKILSEEKYEFLSEQNFHIGWGDYKSVVLKFKKNNKLFTLARFPHFSRFQIFGRAKSKTYIEKILNELFNDQIHS